MKIGILETGEVHPDLKARHGDYPAMFERLLGAVDPSARVRHRAGGRRRDAGLARPGRRLAGDRLAARGLRRPALDRAAQGVPARLRGGAGAGGGHLLRPPAPRRGARRPGGEVRPRLGPRRAGLRGRRPARLDGTTCPTASRCARCTRTRWWRCRRARPCWRARRTAPSPRSPTAIPRRPDAISLQPHPEFGAELHGRAAGAARRHRHPRRGRRGGARLADAAGRQPRLGAADRRLPAPGGRRPAPRREPRPRDRDRLRRGPALGDAGALDRRRRRGAAVPALGGLLRDRRAGRASPGSRRRAGCAAPSPACGPRSG